MCLRVSLFFACLRTKLSFITFIGRLRQVEIPNLSNAFTEHMKVNRIAIWVQIIFYRVSLAFVKFHWFLPGFTGFYRILLGFTEFY